MLFALFPKRSDLPLNEDPVTRFLPWLIGFMVFLAILAAAGVLVLGGVAKRWDSGIAGTLTVQIPAAETVKGAPTGPKKLAQMNAKRLDKVLRVLSAQPGVVHSEAIAAEKVGKLLEPWLGSGSGVIGALALPQLIDVRLAKGTRLDEDLLGQRLNAAVPGTEVDSHRVWLNRLLAFIQSVQALAWGILGLITVATVGTVVFTTRTGLAIHQDVIEVLHLTGAQDSYIARQFGQHALRLGLRGGLLGLALALPTLWGIGYLAGQGQGLLPPLNLAWYHWGLLAAVPFGVAAVAMMAARVTVVRSLKRMV